MGGLASDNANSSRKATLLASDVILSIIYYALCSSVMLIINKVAISFIPLPAFVFFVQLLATVSYIATFKALGVIKADDLSLGRTKTFSPYAVSFIMSIYCNGKVLQHCNVETLITFRACSPLCVSILDWLFLGRTLPSWRSLLSLVGVVVGALGYVLSDSEFRVNGFAAYSWVFIYLLCNVFEMTYGKMVLARVDFEAPVWGSVFYTNALAVGPMAVIALFSGELMQLRNMHIEPRGIFTLVVCCCTGVGISWSGWNCRDKTSATTYTLLGVGCKLISVMLNIMIWDKHATPMGVAWLSLCLFCSAFYRQSPLRSQAGACYLELEQSPLRSQADACDPMNSIPHPPICDLRNRERLDACELELRPTSLGASQTSSEADA